MAKLICSYSAWAKARAAGPILAIISPYESEIEGNNLRVNVFSRASKKSTRGGDMMKAILLTILISSFSTLASAKPYMKCTHITPSRQKITISIDLVKTKSHPHSENVSDLVLKMDAVNATGEKQVYNDSFGWLREDGAFNFSFCQKGKCSMSMSGQITIAGKVKNADLIMPTDSLASSRALTSCGLLSK